MPRVTAGKPLERMVKFTALPEAELEQRKAKPRGPDVLTSTSCTLYLAAKQLKIVTKLLQGLDKYLSAYLWGPFHASLLSNSTTFCVHYLSDVFYQNCGKNCQAIYFTCLPPLHVSRNEMSNSKAAQRSGAFKTRYCAVTNCCLQSPCQGKEVHWFRGASSQG